MGTEENVWYYGSPHVLTVVRRGSIVTQWADLAIVLSLRPKFMTLSEDGQRVLHNGRGRGYLYEIIDPVNVDKDLEVVDSALGEGLEWRALKPFHLRFLCNAEPYKEDVLTSQEVERLMREGDKK